MGVREPDEDIAVPEVVMAWKADNLSPDRLSLQAITGTAQLSEATRAEAGDDMPELINADSEHDESFIEDGPASEAVGRSPAEPLYPKLVDPNTVEPDKIFTGHRNLAGLPPEPMDSGVFEMALESGVPYLSAFQEGPQADEYRELWTGGAEASQQGQRSPDQPPWVYLNQRAWLYVDDVIVAASTEEEFVRLLRGLVLNVQARSAIGMPEAGLCKSAAADRDGTNVEDVWSDCESGWDPWKTVHQLALDAYLAAHPKLGSLAGRKRSGEV